MKREFVNQPNRLFLAVFLPFIKPFYLTLSLIEGKLKLD